MRLQTSYCKHPCAQAFYDRAIFGHLWFLLVAILSVVFYRYRMINLDCAIYSFEMIMDRDFMTPHGRWGAILPQLIPMGLIHLGASLEAILIGFSLSFVLIHYLCWLFVRYVARAPRVALAIVLFQALAWNASFFWPVSEVFQVVIYGLVFYGWLFGKRDPTHWSYFAAIPLLVLLCLFTHPISLLILVVMLMHYVSEGKERNWKTVLQVFAGFGTGVLVWQLLKPPLSPYEAEMMVGIGEVPDILGTIRSRPIFVLGKRLLLEERPLIALVPVLVGLLLAIQGKYRATLLSCISVGVYGLAILVVYHNGESRLMLENVFAPLLLFPVLGLVRHGMPLGRRLAVQYLGIATVMLLLGIRLAAQKQFLDYKHDWLGNMVRYSWQIGERKLILDENRIPSHRYGLRWAIAAESALYSSLENPGRTVMICAAVNAEIFLGPDMDEKIPYTPYWAKRELVNPEGGYFQFQEGPVLYLNKRLQLADGRPSSPLGGFCITIDGHLPGEALALEAGTSNLVPVRVNNHSLFPMISNTTSPLASYLVCRVNSGPEQVRAVDVNILPQSSVACILELEVPPGKGRGQLSVALNNQMFPDLRSNWVFPVRYR